MRKKGKMFMGVCEGKWKVRVCVCVCERKYSGPFFGGLEWPRCHIFIGHLKGWLLVGEEHSMVAAAYGQSKQRKSLIDVDNKKDWP